MESFGIWSLLPPVAALGLALWKKQIYPALLLGVWMGWLVADGWNPIAATGSTVTSIVGVFLDAGNTRILLYSLLVGSVLTLISATGGVEGFVARVSERRLVTTFDARWGEAVSPDAPTRITWEVEPQGDVCRLRVLHEGFTDRTATYESIGQGMAWILSGLKTVLETGSEMAA